MALLEVSNVSFSYDTKPVLQDVSFSIDEGEVVSLLGPSGCGKTTLLNLIAGFLRPSAGLLRFDGRPIDRPGPERAVVFQTGALFEWMTVRQNVEFSLVCRRAQPEERKQISDRMVRLVGLEGSEDRYPYELSGGMRQRVGVARVLAGSPRIMLMDEPFAAVDVQTRELLQEELLRIHADTKCTVVFITHSIEEAVFLSNRVLLLSRPYGRVMAQFLVDLPTPRWDGTNRLHAAFLQLRERIYIGMQQSLKGAVESQGVARGPGGTREGMDGVA